jgi:ubiquinone/menaquinone biosynthesis C-methylase UbiE
MKSKKTSEQFYSELGAEGLAKRKSKSLHRKETVFLKKIIKKEWRTLDLACGYGRMTLELASKGYNVEGLDISSNLIKKAKLDAKEVGLKIKYILGSMLDLPYEKNSFEAIIVLWSAFTELPKKKDQIKALREMRRVLKPGGFVLIDTPYVAKIKPYVRIGDIEIFNKGRKAVANYGGHVSFEHIHFRKKDFKELAIKLNIKKYKISVSDFGGRDRLLFQFWK